MEKVEKRRVAGFEPTSALSYQSARIYCFKGGDWQTITPPAGADVWVKKGEEKMAGGRIRTDGHLLLPKHPRVLSPSIYVCIIPHNILIVNKMMKKGPQNCGWPFN